MRTRHRLSKLLLRHGLVYESGRAWTGAHDAWLRRQRLEHPGARAAFDDYYDAVLGAGLRRDRLDERSPRWPPTHALRRLSGASRACAGSAPSPPSPWRSRSATSIACRVPRSAPTWASPRARASRAPATAAARSPRPATATPDVFWWRRPGTTGRAVRPSAVIERRRGIPAPRGARPRRAGGAAPSPPLASARAPARASLDRRGDGRGARAGGLVLEPCGDGLTTRRAAWARESAPVGRPRTPRGAMRDSAMSSPRATLDPRERPASAGHPVMR